MVKDSSVRDPYDAKNYKLSLATKMGGTYNAGKSLKTTKDFHYDLIVLKYEQGAINQRLLSFHVHFVRCIFEQSECEPR